jgi:dUTP pyrophosphatase
MNENEEIMNEQSCNVGIYKLVDKAVMPVRSTMHSACFDVSVCFTENVEVKVNGRQKVMPINHGNGMQLTMFAGDRVLVPTGLVFTIPEGIKLAVYPRSGLAFNSGITVINSPGTVDCDYNRELFVLLVNTSDRPVIIQDGERIAQIEFVPVITDRINFIEIGEETLIATRAMFETGEGVARKGGIGHTGK